MIIDPRLDIDVLIEGTDGSRISLMGGTQKDSLISVWIEDNEGEAFIELNAEHIERLCRILKRAVEIDTTNRLRRMRKRKVKMT